MQDGSAPDVMVGKLHEVFTQGMSDCYKRKETVKKSSEPPWMTKGILKLITQRRGIFREERRNLGGRAVKKRTKKLIKERKKAYNKEKKDKILSGGVSRFHECVRAFDNDEKTKEWSPRSLYEGKTEQEAAEELAKYFNGISNKLSLIHI